LINRTSSAVAVVVQQLKFVRQSVVKRDITLDAARIAIVQNIFFAPSCTPKVESPEWQHLGENLYFIAIQVYAVEVRLFRQVSLVVGTVNVMCVIVTMPVFGVKQGKVYLERELVVERLGIPHAEVVHGE